MKEQNVEGKCLEVSFLLILVDNDLEERLSKEKDVACFHLRTAIIGSFALWESRDNFRPANAAIELLMTGNKLPGLTSLISNCIGWMDMCWYGDNLMNPWTQHVKKELFNLVEPLWWYGVFAVGLIWDL
ncbi:hypothetical protein AVEN_204951-1 [Araneus ventricosus]|uniref:Uncharacterized protein n=1 Tax=Araneus ventricosus TaxID=182803 RepID=A0A4Y2RKH9_ARAVE|nr:hypothetical protein AVEN_77754-1 [Araneus ventricosus]GBN75405.1 hypothetical protein AVEN_204951-1 [Araneus ventricosus]